jgi:hypothetical protein
MDTDCFAKAIEKEIAAIETERQRAQETKAREQKNFDAACRTALRVRAEVILPLLNGLCDAFAETKVLPRWEVATAGETEAFSATCRSCPAGPGEPVFRITAEAAVRESGAKLDLAVACECEDPGKATENKTAELCSKESYSVGAAGCNMTDAHRWYYVALEKCALACVREKQKQAS